MPPTLWLRAALLGQWRLLTVGCLAIIAANGLALLPPYFIGRAVDALTHSQQDMVPLLALALAATALAAAIAQFVRRISFNKLGYQVEAELRDNLLAHLVTLDQRFFQQTRTGDIMARATNDLTAVQALFGVGISNLANAVVIFVAVLALMLVIDWQLTVISVCLLGIPYLPLLALGPRNRSQFGRIREQFAALTTKAQENLSGIRVVKAYVQEEAASRSFRALNQEYVDRNMAWARSYFLLWPIFAFIDGAASVALLYLGGIHVVMGRVSLGQFVQFVTYLVVMSGPVLGIGWVVNYLYQGAASLRRIEDMLTSQSTIRSPALPVTPFRLRGDITFEDVFFSYDGRPVFEHLSFRLPAGSTVGIVGSVGSGKSTLVRLLLRVYDPQRGRILLDGVDLRDLPLGWLRTQVGCVLQEPFLFSDTLGRNINLGVPDASEDEIARAVTASHLSADIDQFPEGLETVVGERGITLSGGQKQRIALARCLLRRPVVLVLDDAFSSVDAATEEVIVQQLRVFLRERTALIVAHRVSAVTDADRILVLDGGRIAEQGTHRDLLTSGGLYARLYGRQQLARVLEDDSGVAFKQDHPTW